MTAPVSQPSRPRTEVGHCSCCDRPNAFLVPSKVPNGLPSQFRLCGTCSRHRGDSSAARQRMNKDHCELYALDADEAIAAAAEASSRRHAEEVAQLKRELHKAQADLRERPVQIRYEVVDQDKLNEAQEQRDSAYRSRDAAFRTLSEVGLLHRGNLTGACRCGSAVGKCETASVLRESWLAEWELRQQQRWKEGRDHTLPWNHPALTDPRWRPEGRGEQ